MLKAIERERTTIGTLNEKLIHHTLKCYYCDDSDQEVKIGGFFADGAGENGIFEIQSANFGYLAKKLSQMLRGKIRAIPGDSPAVILRVPRESEAPAYVFELFNKYARLKGI